MKKVYTWSEMEAYRLLGEAGKIIGYNTTNPSIDAHEAGTRIIELAERIKSDRAIITMES